MTNLVIARACLLAAVAALFPAAAAAVAPSICTTAPVGADPAARAGAKLTAVRGACPQGTRPTKASPPHIGTAAFAFARAPQAVHSSAQLLQRRRPPSCHAIPRCRERAGQEGCTV